MLLGVVVVEEGVERATPVQRTVAKGCKELRPAWLGLGTDDRPPS